MNTSRKYHITRNIYFSRMVSILDKITRKSYHSGCIHPTRKITKYRSIVSLRKNLDVGKTENIDSVCYPSSCPLGSHNKFGIYNTFALFVPNHFARIRNSGSSCSIIAISRNSGRSSSGRDSSRCISSCANGSSRICQHRESTNSRDLPLWKAKSQRPVAPFIKMI